MFYLKNFKFFKLKKYKDKRKKQKYKGKIKKYIYDN